jgi:hypothetical protein
MRVDTDPLPEMPEHPLVEIEKLRARVELLTGWLRCRYMHGDMPCNKCGFVGIRYLSPTAPVPSAPDPEDVPVTRPWKDASPDFQAGYRAGWADREADILCGIDRVAPTAPARCPVCENGTLIAPWNCVCNGIAPTAPRGEKESK